MQQGGVIMDPATIAASVVTILAPFAKDAGKELVKTVGEIAVNKAKDLLAWLKHRFENDPSASKDLSRFEADPDKFESGLKATVEEAAAQDPSFAAELKQRIDEIGPVITVFQKIKKGEDVTGIDAEAVRTGKLSVTQEADEVKKMTGVRAKTIGSD